MANPTRWQSASALVAVGLAAVCAMMAGAAESPVWQWPGGGTDARYAGGEKAEAPAVVYQDPDEGPMEVRFEAPLEPGLYELAVTYVNPEKPVTLRAVIGGALQPRYETYRFAGAGERLTYRYPFRVREGLPQRWSVGVAPLTGTYIPLFGQRLEIASVAVYPYEPEPRPALDANRPYCDLWGWEACIDYQRPEPASLEQMLADTVIEPWKWGANMAQLYPHMNRGAWREVWTEEERLRYLEEMSRRGFLVDEHGGVNSHFMENNYIMARRWGIQDGAILRYGWDHVVDTWETEAMTHALGKSDDPESDLLQVYEILWRFNPGTPMNLCDQRPNTWQGGGAIWDMVETYRGPNFIKTIMCANWCEIPGTPPIPVLAYTDMNPIRVFPEGLGLHDGTRRLFLAYQSDSRLFSYAPEGAIGSIFGGGTTPDLILREADDFYRPRARNPEKPHATAMFWLGETEQVLPRPLRDAVYAASMDPIRHAFAGRLSATGFGGTLDWRWRVFEETHETDIACPWAPVSNERRPATTSFLQGDRLRLTASAAAPFLDLQFDPEELAEYDSDGIALDLLRGMGALPASEGGVTVVEDAPLPIQTAFEPSGECGYLVVSFERPALAAPVDISVDGRKVAEVTAGLHEVRAPVDFGAPGERAVSITTPWDTPLKAAAVRFEPTGLVKPPPIYAVEFAPEKPLAENTVVEAGEGAGRLPGAWTEEAAATWRFELPEGNYQLRVRARSADGGALYVYRDGWTSVNRTFAEHFGLVEYKMGLCGELAWESGAEGWRAAPVDIHFDGSHSLELALQSGALEIEAVELRPAPVQHSWPERGGNRAVLVERFLRENGGATAQETRRYVMENGRPWLYVEVTSPKPFYELPVPGYERLELDEERNPPRYAQLADEDAVLPPLSIVFGEGSGADVAWRPNEALRLAGEDQLTFWVLAPGTTEDLAAVARTLNAPQPRLRMAGPTEPVTFRADAPASGVEIVEVSNAGPGPYLVREQGWWYARGAQPSKVKPGADLLKLYAAPGEDVRVQQGGFIEGVVRPGWGCQNLVSIRDVSREDDASACAVRVDSSTAYVFAPRVQFSPEVKSVRVDGAPWPYFDEGFVFLPTAPGTYRVEAQHGEADTPHLICSSGMLREGRWDAEARTLNLDIGVQPWTESVPESLGYYALIAHEGWELEKVDGAEVIDISAEAELPPEVAAAMDAEGFAVRFLPWQVGAQERGTLAFHFAARR